MFKKLQL